MNLGSNPSPRTEFSKKPDQVPNLHCNGSSVLNSIFTLDTAALVGLEVMAKEAEIKWQILNQCEGNFRVIEQTVFPALTLIGNTERKDAGMQALEVDRHISHPPR